MRIRQGRKNPHNLYLMRGAEPSDDDVSIGYIRTGTWAAALVAAVNGEENPRRSGNGEVEWERAEEMRVDRLGPNEDDVETDPDRPESSLGGWPKT